MSPPLRLLILRNRISKKLISQLPLFKVHYHSLYLAQFRGLQARKEVDQIKKTTTKKFTTPEKEQLNAKVSNNHEIMNPHAPLPQMAKLVGSVPTFLNEKTQNVEQFI